jgi:pilus assembly protein CpaE
LGLALLRTTGGRIGIVDLDLQQGGLIVALGVKPERTILPLAAVAVDKLDPGALEAALTRHPTGLYLLAAPGRIEESEQVSDTTVEAVLELMERLFDYVVVDCGRHVDGNTAVALERSREVLYVLRQSEGAARGALRFMDLLGRLRIRREPRLVLNCYDPRSPLTEARLAAVVRRPIYARIPRDDRLLEQAAVLGRTPWQIAPRSALVRAYEKLAQRLSGAEQPKDEPHTAHPAGVIARLLSALGARA